MNENTPIATETEIQPSTIPAVAIPSPPAARSFVVAIWFSLLAELAKMMAGGPTGCDTSTTTQMA